MTSFELTPARPASHWRSAELIEILPAAVYVCDADAVVVAYNGRAAELWGRRPMPGDTDEKYCGSHKLYRTDGTFMPHRETPMEAVLRTGKGTHNTEVVIERPDGSRITALVNIAPLFDDGGKLAGAVNCFQDLSAQKQAEQERLQLVADLHQARKMDALGQLTAGIAHDFNNLLAVMLANLETLERQVGGPQQQKLVHNVMRAARRGIELSGHLLGFARKKDLLPKTVDVDELLADMADILRTTTGGTIRLEMRARDHTWPARVDPNELELVILNLVINARDAMPFGGALTIGTRNATMAKDDPPGTLAAGDYVVLSIGDSGIGMSAEVLAKAVEPFFTTKGPGYGSGLGLSMAMGVARQSGGDIRIASQPGEGTLVELFLPRSTAEA